MRPADPQRGTRRRLALRRKHVQLAGRRCGVDGAQLGDRRAQWSVGHRVGPPWIARPVRSGARHRKRRQGGSGGDVHGVARRRRERRTRARRRGPQQLESANRSGVDRHLDRILVVVSPNRRRGGDDRDRDRDGRDPAEPSASTATLGGRGGGRNGRNRLHTGHRGGWRGPASRVGPRG